MKPWTACFAAQSQQRSVDISRVDNICDPFEIFTGPLFDWGKDLGPRVIDPNVDWFKLIPN
jgi:hypothetical protein